VAPPSKRFISTGSTLLNLACTGDPFKGFPSGKYTYIVGDTQSGKTFLCMTCLAEATINPEFDNYRLILDNIEDGMLLDVEGLFNKQLAERIEPPSYEKKKPKFSRTIEEFYYNLDNAVTEGQPFIYVLDSMDALGSDADKEHFEAMKKAHEEGKDVSGTYGTAKAKANSDYLREAVADLRDTQSILIIVSQTRDNFGMGAKKTRSGGNALPFYASLFIWSKVRETITKTVRKKKRKIGTLSRVRVDKNRITGLKGEVEIPIYPNIGFDDVGACVDYLVSEKWWSKTKNTITAPEFDLEGTSKTVIREIENRNGEGELRKIVGKCWNEIAEECKIERKPRYR